MRSPLAAVGRILAELRLPQREIRARPEADAGARADAHHLAGRGAVTTEPGRPGTARKVPGRLRAPAARYGDPGGA
ncbi:hypothetical protein ACGFZK_11435 [Streptomyces sp. NPDC048257]|uniref:hypothetical protein n=1 Tax=Streptomyces sp. NPDC048257 TaxID=3365526 RepID=UPI003711A65B